MINEEFFSGLPVEFKKLCLVYPPSVNDMLNKKNNSYLHLLTMTQEDIEDEITENNTGITQFPTPFEYLFLAAHQSSELSEFVRAAFKFCIHEEVMLLPQKKLIIIGDITELTKIEEMRLLNEDDYFDFQNLVRDSIGQEPEDPPQLILNPKIRAMKAKARYRDKIKAKSGKNLKMTTLIAALCCMNIGLSPLNIGELSYAAIPTLMGMYQQKEKYEIDIRSLLAGADSKKVFIIWPKTSLRFISRVIIRWLTRNPSCYITMGTSWENLSITQGFI